MIDPVHAGCDGNCSRHIAGNLIVFAHGHAKWERWNQSKAYKTNPVRTTP